MRLKRHGLLCSLFAMALCWNTVLGGTYHVSPMGSDENPGSLALSWRTIGKANITVQAGDTVLIREGVYLEDVNPAHSGEYGNRIVYMGYPGEEAVIRGFGIGRPDGEAVVALGFPGSAKGWSSASHITVQNLTIFPLNENIIWGIIVIGYESNVCEIKNCHVIWDSSLPPVAKGIVVYSTVNTLIENNTIHGPWDIGIITTGIPQKTVIRGNTIFDTYASCIDIQSSDGRMQGMLIENNDLYGSRIEDGIQFEPDYTITGRDPGLNRGVIIRNNSIHDNAENAIDLKGADYVVVEGNTIWGHRGEDNSGDPRGAGLAIMRGLDSQSEMVIVRKNRIYDNCGGIDTEGGGYVIVHNDIIGNNRDYEGSHSQWNGTQGAQPLFVGIRIREYMSDVLVRNNIVGGHHQAEIGIMRPETIDDIEIDANVYFHRDEVQMLDSENPQDELLFAAWKNRLADLHSVTGKDNASSVTDPMLRDVPGDEPAGSGPFDFTLQSSSPAIDAGTFLTHTRSAGSGNSLPVLNPKVFCDGFGIVEGDVIQIASNGLQARIVSIDYETGVLTIDREIEWLDSDGVSYPYSGSAPDIGAHEFDDTTDAAATRSIIKGLEFSKVLQDEDLTQIKRGAWVDMTVFLDDNIVWSSLTYIDVWLHSPAYTGGYVRIDKGPPGNPRSLLIRGVEIE